MKLTYREVQQQYGPTNITMSTIKIEYTTTKITLKILDRDKIMNTKTTKSNVKNFNRANKQRK